jgi:hypothetical protein
MLSFPAAIKLFLCTVPCDMLRTFDGLSRCLGSMFPNRGVSLELSLPLSIAYRLHRKCPLTPAFGSRAYIFFQSMYYARGSRHFRAGTISRLPIP